jgi:hypothetical protein
MFVNNNLGAKVIHIYIIGSTRMSHCISLLSQSTTDKGFIKFSLLRKGYLLKDSKHIANAFSRFIINFARNYY